MNVLVIKSSIGFSGHCTEYNDKAGIIIMQRRAPCSNIGFPKCSPYYKSEEAYKCKVFINGCFSINDVYL